jgi:thiol:disulfide interchange protein DsbD
MALVYAAVGLLAAVAGAGLQAVLQNPWAIGAFAALFALLALSMFGFYELQLPAWARERLTARTPAGGTLAGAAAMGVLSALLVGPCMTAPLAGTLLYVAQSGRRAEGALLLLALGLGMGVPLVVISTVGARWLPRPGVWMNRVKGAFGFVMLATAASMLQRVLPGAVMLLLWGALLTALAVTVWHLASARSGSALVVRSAAALAGLWGAALVFGAAAGATDPVRPLASLRAGAAPAAAGARFEVLRDPAQLQARLAQARERGQPALLEFSADWCTSCKTLEHEVFADPRVARALDGVLLLRADVTAGDARQRAFMRTHEVMGPPTVLLFDAAGTERRADRLVGEFAPEELLRRHPAGGAS